MKGIGRIFGLTFVAALAAAFGGIGFAVFGYATDKASLITLSCCAIACVAGLGYFAVAQKELRSPPA
jgi:hypothetical protein